MAQPLTKIKRDGTPYTRFADIEANIDAALDCDLASLGLRLGIGQRAAEGFLTSECIVYLLRRSIGTGDAPRRDILLQTLLRRCERLLRSIVSDTAVPAPEQFREDCLGAFSLKLARELGAGDELDFYECTFVKAFKLFCLGLLRAEKVRQSRLAEIESDFDSVPRWGTSDASPSGSPEAFVVRSEMKAAIDALPPEERTALILVHFYGVPIDSKDPNKPTAASRCNVTGRTIQNRITRAIQKLTHL